MTVIRPIIINQPQIGKLIRELRLETGLTQEQFAAELGVTYSTINRWENGRAKPSPLALKLIEGMLWLRGNHGKDLLKQHFDNFTHWQDFLLGLLLK
jgi:transcriptional regulator with XRE-family HTH domain